ncbi:DUF3857 domain-containing protein [uncultured Dokdonia sp.]|uniref:DUF3857 domain-containing protein n=1 Tax=uncultured Dokdonia sp. TaxID=575653 RepID=UPI0026199143|nr:DUF3857 domain-containing protein [uncultured Dokdonia sp.]
MPKNRNSKIYFIKYFIYCLLTYSFLFTKVIAQESVNRFEIKPTPNWIKKYPTPKLKNEYDLDLVLIQNEFQYNNITKEYSRHFYYYINTIEGLNELRAFATTYDPSFQEFSINAVKIHRSGNIINLGESLHVNYELFEKQISGEQYDSDAKVTIYFEEARVGDFIEIAYTTKGQQPDVYDKLLYKHYPYKKSLRGTDYVRVLNTPEKPLFFTSLNYDNTPIRIKNNEFNTIEFISKNDEKKQYPDTPIWHTSESGIYFFDTISWEDYIQVHLDNYDLNTPPSEKIRNKVKELIKDIPSKQEQINAILNFTQKNIHYLDYGLIDPKKPETVLKQGFGDCKSKSLLTIKMLECLQVKSWPLIVKSDGLDERLLNIYSGQMFDHAVVEFVHTNDTIIFDPTTYPQKGGIKEKYVSNFRYGARIKEGEKKITKLNWHSSNSLNVITSIYKQKNNDDEYRTHNIDWKVSIDGQLANEHNYVYKENGINSVFELVSDLISERYLSLRNFELAYFIDENKPHSVLDITSKETISVFDNGNSNGSITFEPISLHKWLKITEPDELGPFFSLSNIRKTNQLFKIHKLEWMNFTPDSTHFKNDWITYTKKSWVKDDTIYASYVAELLKTHLDSSRYKDVRTSINDLKGDMRLLLSKGTNKPQDNYKTYRNRIYIIYGIILLVIGAIVFFFVRSIIKGRERKALIHKLHSEIATLKKESDTSKK